MRRGVKPRKAKGDTRRPVARKSPKNEASGRRELEKRLTEALEQQTATAEILRVIGTSPTDTQPVFDGIARSGVGVCGAQSCTLFVVDGDMVRVAATHGGVGIAPEDQEAVFEEFRQVGASAAKQEGSGLGLALCRKFVELHGGKIRVTSTVGAGSTFTFTLPFQR